MYRCRASLCHCWLGGRKDARLVLLKVVTNVSSVTNQNHRLLSATLLWNSNLFDFTTFVVWNRALWLVIGFVYDRYQHGDTLEWRGVAGNVHSWIQSCLTDRISLCVQHIRLLSPRVPSRKALSLDHCFFRYTPIFTIAESHQVHQQQYADDTQLYLALSPSGYTHDISTLQSCLDSLHIWFCENSMALNASKSVVILFGTSQRLKSLSGLKSVSVAETVIPVSDKIKILCTTLDSNLTMEPHTKTLSISSFYHIRSLKQIHSSLDDSMAGSVASSLVSSRLDYVNSLLYCISLKNINRLQWIQHSLARVVTNRRSHALPSATVLLKQLHRLPVEWHIQFKLTTFTIKALHTGRPPYLSDQLQYYQPTRSLRLSGSHQLVKPQHNLSFGSRAFRTSAPHFWNSLRTNIREAQSVLTFRRHLKTHYNL